LRAEFWFDWFIFAADWQMYEAGFLNHAIIMLPNKFCDQYLFIPYFLFSKTLLLLVLGFSVFSLESGFENYAPQII
jgi:hypothetical protein